LTVRLTVPRKEGEEGGERRGGGGGERSEPSHSYGFPLSFSYASFFPKTIASVATKKRKGGEKRGGEQEENKETDALPSNSRPPLYILRRPIGDVPGKN